MSSYQPEAGGAALASRGSRLAAVLLDGIIFSVPIFVFGVIGAVTETEALIAVGGVISLAILIAQLVLQGTRGQTLGKMALGIRIVDFNTGGHPGFARIVLLRVIVNGLIGGFIPPYVLVDALFIFREDQRCIHDHIAGTRVVQA